MTAQLGGLMARWQDAVQRYDQLVGDHEGLTQTERHCIALLVGGTLSPHEIASGIHLTRAAVTSLLDRLEGRRLVQRAPDLADRRKVQVSLTAGGNALCQRHYGTLVRRGQALLAAMSEAELAAMVRFLEQALTLQAEVTGDLLAVPPARRRPGPPS